MSVSNSLPRISRNCPEVGIYQKKQESKIERKHAFHQESDQEKRKKNSNQLEQEKKQVLKSYFFSFINSHLWVHQAQLQHGSASPMCASQYIN